MPRHDGAMPTTREIVSDQIFRSCTALVIYGHILLLLAIRLRRLLTTFLNRTSLFKSPIELHSAHRAKEMESLNEAREYFIVAHVSVLYTLLLAVWDTLSTPQRDNTFDSRVWTLLQPISFLVRWCRFELALHMLHTLWKRQNLRRIFTMDLRSDSWSPTCVGVLKSICENTLQTTVEMSLFSVSFAILPRTYYEQWRIANALALICLGIALLFTSANIAQSKDYEQDGRPMLEME